MCTDWIKTEELAEVLGISTRAVRKAIQNKKYVSNKTNRKHEIYVPSLDMDLQQKIVKHFDKNNLIENITYTEEEKKLALTKYNIVTRWRDFLLFYKGTKSDSVKDFMAIHNSVKDKGMTFMSIKNVSPVTMFRWDKKLRDNNNNWQALLNKYHPCCKKTLLSQKEQEVFLKFLLHPNKTNIGKAIKLTKYVLKEQGFITLCCDMTYRRSAKKYIEEHYDLWVFSREGSKALRDKVIPYIQRDVSNLNVGDVIVGDGHRLAFQVINPFTGKPCRPTLVAYQDWKSGGIIGFEIMIEENTQCIASALRNSIINLGKIPKYIYQDNGKAFKSNYFKKAEKLY